jgi:hypothetical protein
MVLKTLRIMPALAILLLPAAAAAERYSCVVEARYTLGWFAEQYVITLDATQSGLSVVERRQGRQMQPQMARVTANNARRLSGSFRGEDLRTSSGVFIDVSYSFTITRPDLRFRGSATVGRQGQTENARGQCARVG